MNGISVQNSTKDCIIIVKPSPNVVWENNQTFFYISGSHQNSNRNRESSDVGLRYNLDSILSFL